MQLTRFTLSRPSPSCIHPRDDPPIPPCVCAEPFPGAQQCVLRVLSCQPVKWPSPDLLQAQHVEPSHWLPASPSAVAYECEVELVTGRTHQVGTVQRSTGLTAARTRLVPCSAAQALQLHAPGGYRACGGARATLLRPHSPGANLVSETHTKCRSAQGAAVLPAHPLRCPGAIKPPYSASVPSGRRGGGWAVAVLSHCCCRCGPGMGVGAVLQLRGAAQ